MTTTEEKWVLRFEIFETPNGIRLVCRDSKGEVVDVMDTIRLRKMDHNQKIELIYEISVDIYEAYKWIG